jgi:hypothetical protein
LLAPTAAAQEPSETQTLEDARARALELRQQLTEVSAVTGNRMAIPSLGLGFDSPYVGPGRSTVTACTRCEALDGFPQTLADWQKYGRILEVAIAESIETAPLCSGKHAAFERGLQAMERQARWSLENRTRAEDAASDAQSLDAAVADYQGRLEELIQLYPNLKAERERLGFPIPPVCDGSERELQAGLASVREKIAILRERAGAQ